MTLSRWRTGSRSAYGLPVARSYVFVALASAAARPSSGSRVCRRVRARSRGSPQAFPLHRLEQVVDGVQFEGLDGMVVECGDEGDEW
jgi:hypothetical protein